MIDFSTPMPVSTNWPDVLPLLIAIGLCLVAFKVAKKLIKIVCLILVFGCIAWFVLPML